MEYHFEKLANGSCSGSCVIGSMRDLSLLFNIIQDLVASQQDRTAPLYTQMCRGYTDQGEAG